MSKICSVLKFSKRNAHKEMNWTYNHMIDSAFCHQHYYFTLLSKKGLWGIECRPRMINPDSDHFGALTICRRASTSFKVGPSRTAAWCCLHKVSADTALIRVSTAVAWRLIFFKQHMPRSTVAAECIALLSTNCSSRARQQPTPIHAVSSLIAIG